MEGRILGQEAVLLIQVRAALVGQEGRGWTDGEGMLRRYTRRERGPGILLGLLGGKFWKKLDSWGRQPFKTWVDITRTTQMPLK